MIFSCSILLLLHRFFPYSPLKITSVMLSFISIGIGSIWTKLTKFSKFLTVITSSSGLKYFSINYYFFEGFTASTCKCAFSGYSFIFCLKLKSSHPICVYLTFCRWDVNCRVWLELINFELVEFLFRGHWAFGEKHLRFMVAVCPSFFLFV